MRIDNEKGQAAVESTLIAAIFLIVVIAVVEMAMLYVRSSLLAYAASRVARLASVYSMTHEVEGDLARQEARAILPATDVHDDTMDNRHKRILQASYEPYPVTRLDLFFEQVANQVWVASFGESR